jgi:hypothetical protein
MIDPLNTVDSRLRAIGIVATNQSVLLPQMASNHLDAG